MGETVKAQAIRRGKELDVLATVYDAILASREAMEQTTRVIERYGEWFDGLHAENAELREEILALSNRIESVVRAVAPEWVCLCGARNRLRDTACRHCGDHKP